MVGWKSLEKKLCLDIQSVEALAHRFASKLKETGRYNHWGLSIEEYAECQNVSLTSELREIFDICDVRDLQRISFREFVLLSSFVQVPPDLDESFVQSIFRMFNPNEGGLILLRDIKEIFEYYLNEDLNLNILHNKYLSSFAQCGEISFANFHSFLLKFPHFVHPFIWCKNLIDDIITQEKIS